MKPILPFDRSKQILKCLIQYELLPAYGLRFMIEPSIFKRRICDSLARLYKSGLITKRYDSCIGDHVPFYGLSRLKHKARKIIALTAACPTDQALVKPTKITEPIHWMYTSILFHRIKKMFPDCTVRRGLRGIDMPSDARPPDLTLSIFAPSIDQSIQIAIYVEIDIKSEKMIKQRLNRHLAHPCFDFVIIADCDDEVFRTAEIIQKSKRFNRTQWMFLSNNFVQNDEPLVLFNAELKNILFQKFVQEIRNKICLTSEIRIEPKQHMTAEVRKTTHDPRNQENESKIKSIEVLGRGS